LKIESRELTFQKRGDVKKSKDCTCMVLTGCYIENLDQHMVILCPTLNRN